MDLRLYRLSKSATFEHSLRSVYQLAVDSRFFAGEVFEKCREPILLCRVTVKKPAPKPAPQPTPKPAAQVGGFQAGDTLGSKAPGTGAHGQEWRKGFLWMAVPPSREVYQLDPKTWVVQRKFPTAGNRPHGIGWEGKYLWVADSNLNAFFKHDPDTGAMLEKLQLADNDPLPHGMTIREGWLWYCDDVGVVCKLKL